MPSFRGRNLWSGRPLPVAGDIHMQAADFHVPAIVCDAGLLSQVAIIQELGRLRIPVIAVSDSPTAIGFSSRYIRQRILCPVPSYHPEYIKFLVSSVPRGVLFYSNDANTENIAQHREELQKSGFSILISSSAILERVIQKHRLYETGLECGVKVPRCRLVSSAAELAAATAEFGAPLILKSTNLAGGVYRFVRSRDAAPAVFHEMQALIAGKAHRHRCACLMAQQWIPQTDTKLWNFNACVRSGEIVSFSMGERIRSDVLPDGWLGSMLLFGRTAYNGRIFEENRRLLRHLAFDGIVETEWSESASEPDGIYLYDFNPRPSGNIRWAFRSGVSLAGQYYRLALGLPPADEAMRTGIVYAKVFFHRNDLFDAIGNPRLSFLEKLAVFKDDLIAVAGCRRYAVDILDPSDLRPTLRATAQLASILSVRLRRFTQSRIENLRLRPHHGN